MPSDDKKTQGDVKTEQSTLEQAIKAVADSIIPAAVAAAVAATQRSNIVQAAPSGRPAPPSNAKCHVCSQSYSGCEGKHVSMVVYPQRYPEHGEYFQGATLNGVRYLSNDEQHEILVPENAVGTISQIVRNFEDNEQDTRIGRKAERRSGVIGPNGSSFNPALKAWR